MPGRIGEQSAFDAWLRRDLRAAYDPALREPLPDELERLLAGVPERGRES